MSGTGCCDHFLGLPLVGVRCALGKNLRALTDGPDFGWCRRLPCRALFEGDQASWSCDDWCESDARRYL